MTFQLQGSYTLGGALPLAVQASAVGAADIQARLAGALEAQAQLIISPPTIGAQIEALLAAIAALQLAPPGAGIDVSAMATVIADLQASVALLASINAAFGASGVYVYTWTGRAGDAVTGGIPGASGDQASFGVYLLTTVPATWSAMQQMFGV